MICDFVNLIGEVQLLCHMGTTLVLKNNRNVYKPLTLSMNYEYYREKKTTTYHVSQNEWRHMIKKKK